MLPAAYTDPCYLCGQTHSAAATRSEKKRAHVRQSSHAHHIGRAWSARPARPTWSAWSAWPARPARPARVRRRSLASPGWPPAFTLPGHPRRHWHASAATATRRPLHAGGSMICLERKRFQQGAPGLVQLVASDSKAAGALLPASAVPGACLFVGGSPVRGQGGLPMPPKPAAPPKAAAKPAAKPPAKSAGAGLGALAKGAAAKGGVGPYSFAYSGCRREPFSSRPDLPTRCVPGSQGRRGEGRRLQGRAGVKSRRGCEGRRRYEGQDRSGPEGEEAARRRGCGGWR
jgi:hypothetical protein